MAEEEGGVFPVLSSSKAEGSEFFVVTMLSPPFFLTS